MSSMDVSAIDNGGLRFWAALAEPERMELRRAGSVQGFPAGTILFHEGDVPVAALIILRGAVKVIMNSAEGHERLLAVRGRGEVIGEVSAVWQIPRSATVQAVDSVEVLSVPRAAFVRTLRRSPAAAMELIKVLGERRRYADQARVELGGSTVTQRVAAMLLNVATRFPPTVDGAVVLPVTQEELASLAATSRSGVARTLSVLRERKAVVTAPRQIILLNIEMLRAIASHGHVSSDMAPSQEMR